MTHHLVETPCVLSASLLNLQVSAGYPRDADEQKEIELAKQNDHRIGGYHGHNRGREKWHGCSVKFSFLRIILFFGSVATCRSPVVHWTVFSLMSGSS